MTGASFWMGRLSRRIEQRVVVEGALVLQTPAQFGNGDGDDLTDMPLLIDACDGVSPLLTGATLAGALRAYLHRREQGYRQPGAPQQGTLTELLFGGFKGDDEGKQSLLIVDDARGENYGTQLRDGVRLAPQSRTADEGGLFDMQVWSAGTTFPIRLELQLAAPQPQTDEPDDAYIMRRDQHFRRLQQALPTALQGLMDGGITLGGRKNRGFGRITVKHWRVRRYDLMLPAQLMAWLREGNNPLTPIYQVEALSDSEVFANLEPAVDKRANCTIRATFKLTGSLLIRASGQPGSQSPDMVHLTDDKGRPVLPGASVAGALRQRARRILQLIAPAHATGWLNDLFGAEKMRGPFKASRLIVEETQIDEPQFDLIQNRVAIDRFTGGAYESALFNEQPVFSKPETRLHINLTIIEPKQRDIGLLLLLLKDLWTGDLPLGGESSVGRGRLEGQHATITCHEDGQSKQWELQQNGAALTVADQDREALEKFVAALWQEGNQ